MVHYNEICKISEILQITKYIFLTHVHFSFEWCVLMPEEGQTFTERVANSIKYNKIIVRDGISNLLLIKTQRDKFR